MEISKENAAKHLRSLGFDAQVSNGVVMVYLTDEEYITKGAKIRRKNQKTLKCIGYTGSTGVAPGRTNE